MVLKNSGPTGPYVVKTDREGRRRGARRPRNGGLGQPILRPAKELQLPKIQQGPGCLPVILSRLIARAIGRRPASAWSIFHKPGWGSLGRLLLDQPNPFCEIIQRKLVGFSELDWEA
jgi:hypothetical protein